MGIISSPNEFLSHERKMFISSPMLLVTHTYMNREEKKVERDYVEYTLGTISSGLIDVVSRSIICILNGLFDNSG